jgi:DNA-binding beta-propeller fold protein YncE
MRVKELVPIFILSLVLLPLAAGGDEGGTTLVTPPWNHCLGLHKVTQFHLDVYSAYREDFDDPQGLFCVKLESEDDLSHTRDDDELTVFGLNSGKHKLIYNKSLTSIGIVGSDREDKVNFNNPQSLSGDCKGNVFIADAGNNRIVHMKYLENDELVLSGIITGPEEDALDCPTGVSFSGGLLYVADSGNDRIAVFDVDGRLRRVFSQFSAGEKLDGPSTIAAVTAGDDWLYYNDHFIAVVDSLGRRLWKLSPDGKVIKRTRFPQPRGGFGHVAIDYYGSIYATDPQNGRIHKYDRHLNYIAAFGESGSGHGQFDEPRGIAIYRRFGQVFVSERAGAQYYWIGTDVLRFTAENLTIDAAAGRLGVDVSFLLTEHSTVSLHIEDEKGEEKYALLKEYLLPAGTYRRHIEVESENAELLANCKVRLVIVAKPTYSSRTFLIVTRESAFLEAELTRSP